MSPLKRKTFEVTAPLSVRLYNESSVLNLDDWRLFEQWTRSLAEMGVDAVIVPISWASVEPEAKVDLKDPNAEITFNWSYYKKIAEILRDNRIGFVPEFCFHFQSATSESENFKYMQPIPEWVWGYLMMQEPGLKRLSDLKYVSETGDACSEVLSLWVDDYAIPLYRNVLKSFRENFRSMGSQIPKIMIGMGPNGELRYPSFNNHDWGGYPNRGTLQCYSKPAFRSWQSWLLNNYGSLEAVNQVYGSDWENWAAVQLPDESHDIFDEKRYLATQYGQDFSSWYSGELVRHGRRMLEMAFDVFRDEPFNKCKIGFRLPAVHWKISDMHMPRAAEITAGIIAAHPDLDINDQREYYKTLNTLIPEKFREMTVVHLSCVEKENKDYKGFSRAEDLALWVAEACRRIGVRVVAENGTKGGLLDNVGWNQLDRALFDVAGFHGLNVISLRILFDHELAKNRLKRMIEQAGSENTFVPVHRKSFRVMGPLHLSAASDRRMISRDDWQEFDRQLRLMKEAGVEAISVDVWWGLVQQQGPTHFDWNYYDRIVQLIRLNGLNWVPILSFHQAGGNVNDDFTQWTPVWLWGELMQGHTDLTLSDFQYVSESGAASVEYVSLWADEYVLPYYRRFMEAFKRRFAPYEDMTAEINISLGPAGELRYPSYNAHDWGDYPNRGTLQCYSKLAVEDFREYLQRQYTNIKEMNIHWETAYLDFSEVMMPKAPDDFFGAQTYYKTVMGRDLISWYHNSLLMHGRRVLKVALEVFSGEHFDRTPLGFKIAGVHWNISNPNMPRVSEITAGLLNAHPHLNGTDQREYLEMLNILIDKEDRERLVVHFTCLEKFNKDHEGFSRAEDLVRWVADAAAELKINVAGENATTYELSTGEGWSQMERALTRTNGYSGLTILRIKNLLDTEYGFSRFKELIKKLG
ncbi:family 14 glycosylhydrolase [Persicobacter psychrovividus]|uniref:Beta-amylase n=1 Tax=Persicobacter psychrovividus TaxID=387638 RepID=A0ABN6LA29_9BACT|nr:hypothetical protein PEPS_21360 [Persicobacter psychrovividus]